MINLPIDQNEKFWYKAGGVSSIAIGIGYIVITFVYILAGAKPSSAEAWLIYLANHTTAWWIIIALSVITDFLFIPMALSLYHALKRIHKNAAWIGTLLIALFVFLDLSITWPNYSSLMALSASFTAASGETQRATYIAAANYAYSVLRSPTLSVYIILVPALGIFIISLAMLKGVFGKATAYVGLATGVLGVVAVVGPLFAKALGQAVIPASVLTLIWCLLVGYRLMQA